MWPAEEFEPVAQLIHSQIGDAAPPAKVLAELANAAFWLNIEPFEASSLRPVFRWRYNEESVTSHAQTRLPSPVLLSDRPALRRLVAGWQAPRKPSLPT